jgi:hypothetical protein
MRGNVSMLRRSFAFATALGLTLVAGSAAAQTPMPGPYAPPGYLPPNYMLTPYTPMKRKSKPMIIAGSLLTTVGVGGLIMGTSMFTAGARGTTVFPPCAPDGLTCPPEVTTHDEGLRAGGIAAIVLSVVSICGGIPLWVIGSQMVPDNDEASVTALVPRVRGTSLSWSF